MPLAALLYTFPLFLGAAEITPIFSTNATWKMFKGRTEASAPVTAWRAIDFNDAAFTFAPPKGAGRVVLSELKK